MSLIVLRVNVTGTTTPPPASKYVAVPNPVNIAPGGQATVTVKVDDGSGNLSALPASATLVPFWLGTNLGIMAQTSGDKITLTVPATATIGTGADLNIDVR